MTKLKAIWELERRLTDNKRAKANAEKDKDDLSLSYWQYYAGKVDAYEVAVEIVKEIEEV